MKKNMVLADFVREIRGNMGRFLSIFFIVMLGAAFFTGIRSTESSMKYTGDLYYDDCDLMDFRILSTLGLTEEDLSDLRSVEGVSYVEGGHTAEALTQVDDKNLSVRLIGITEGVNEIYLEEGDLPQNDHECVVDAYYAREYDISVGDTITFFADRDGDIGETLSVSTFTVSGLGDIPYYGELTRGTGSIGTGSIDFFVGINPGVFCQDVYTEAYVIMDGAAELNMYSDAYDEMAEEMEERLTELGETACMRRYDALTAEIEEAELAIDDGEAELAEAKAQIEDGWDALSKAEEMFAEQEAELDDAKAQIEDGEAELAEAKEQYEDGLARYNEGVSAYEEGLLAYEEGFAAYEEGLAAYNENYRAYAEALPAYEEGLAQYEEGLSAYEEGLSSYNSGIAVLQTLESLYDTLASETERLRAESGSSAGTEDDSSVSDYGEEALEAAESALAYYKEQIDEMSAELAAAKTELDTAKVELDAFSAVKDQMDEAKSALDAAKAELDSAYLTLSLTKLELDGARDELKDSKEQLDDAKKEIDAAEQELSDGRTEIEEGERALSEAKEETEESRRELSDAEEEYEEAAASAEEEFADAREEIAAAREELSSVEIPEWYILGRDMITSVSGYGENADRMKNLGTVFPVVFFLVAALVSLTAMTRMVEEQRTQIGTYKALGFSDGVIVAKYLGYALAATVLGSFAGVLVGGKLLPLIIIYAYGMLYVSIPYLCVPYNWTQNFLAMAVSVLCISIATISACYRQLRANPATLMRPDPPKNGKRVFLERWTFFWRHLSFNYKTSIRNLFRYQKRFFMTVIGIGGCMALLLVGFGLNDSIKAVAKMQYIELLKQDATLTLDTSADEEVREDFIEWVNDTEGMQDSMQVYMMNVDLSTKGHSITSYLYVPEDEEKAEEEFITLRDRKSKKYYDYPTDGVALSEQTASILDVGVGDEVTVKLGDEKAKSVKVSYIVENYVQHYMYMSGDLYESLYGKAPEYNMLYVQYEDNSSEFEDAFAVSALREDGCLGVSFTTDYEKMIDDMLQSLNIVVVVLILAAGALAFVVLYNLNNINITERKRELATLKVLGFYDIEVAMNVYRENIFLTLIGIIVGIGIGSALHQFTIRTVEVETMMFGRTISATSYLLSSLIAFLFAVIVNIMMFYRLRKIDMIESLKSVE